MPNNNGTTGRDNQPSSESSNTVRMDLLTEHDSAFRNHCTDFDSHKTKLDDHTKDLTDHCSEFSSHKSKLDDHDSALTQHCSEFWMQSEKTKNTVNQGFSMTKKSMSDSAIVSQTSFLITLILAIPPIINSIALLQNNIINDLSLAFLQYTPCCIVILKFLYLTEFINNAAYITQPRFSTQTVYKSTFSGLIDSLLLFLYSSKIEKIFLAFMPIFLLTPYTLKIFDVSLEAVICLSIFSCINIFISYFTIKHLEKLHFIAREHMVYHDTNS